MKKFRLYKDASRQWRSAFYAANGNCQFVSSESYQNEADCRSAIASVQDSRDAEIVVDPMTLAEMPAVVQPPEAEPVAAQVPKPAAKRKRRTPAKRR